MAGSALIEAICGLLLISVVLVGGVLLLFDAAIMISYANKVSYAAQAGAMYVTDTTEWLGATRPSFTRAVTEARVKHVVNHHLTTMGLPSTDDISITTETRGKHKYSVVRIGLDKLPLFTTSWFPRKAAVSETAVSEYQNAAPTAVLGMTYLADGHGIFLPSYGAGNNTSGPKSYPKTPAPIAYFAVFNPSGALQGPYSGVMGNSGPYTPFPN